MPSKHSEIQKKGNKRKEWNKIEKRGEKKTKCYISHKY